MDFEWDEDKRLTNLRKHGVDFVDVPSIFDRDTIMVEDNRYSYSEQRFITFGSEIYADANKAYSIGN
jgi:uncharacterized protein